MRLTIFFLLFWVMVCKAQEAIKKDHSSTDWYLEQQKETPNYQKVRELYQRYFEAHPYERSQQKSATRRWLDVYENYQDKDGIVRPVVSVILDYEQFRKLNTVDFRENRLAGGSPYPEWNDMTGTWRMIGPYHAKGTKCSGAAPYMSGGFNDRVYINPYNTKNLFSGHSYGGLWVSQDKGATWKLTDAEFPNGKNTYANRDIYYGEIEAHPKNPKLILAASEAGLMKSENGGEQWALLNDLNYQSRPTERAYFVAMSPSDSKRILASYGRKIYLSVDGGNTWIVTFDNTQGGGNLTRNQHSTIGLGGRWYNFFGVKFYPKQPNMVYLGAYNAAGEACIHQSTDGGNTFTLLKNTANKAWVKLQVSSAVPDGFYLFELFAAPETNTNDNFYKFDLSGKLVKQLKYPPIKSLVDDVALSETDSSVIYLGGYASGEVYKSTDGGKTFKTPNPGYTSCPNYVHPDVRAFSVVGNDVLIATDGGPYLSSDAMTTVKPVGSWISAIDLWGFSASFKDDILAAGCDHGPTKIRLFDGESGWVEIGGGDASDISVNPVDSRWVYANDGYNKFRVQLLNNKTTISARQAVVAANYRYLAFHPNIYYQSYPFKDNLLMVSKDNMTTATTLFTFTQNITKVKVSVKNTQVIYVLTNKQNFWKSTDGGASFVNITPAASVSANQTVITDFELGSNKDELLWLAYGNVQKNCKLLMSNNGGTTWTNQTGSLPSALLSQISYQRGTDGGVYATTDGSGVWYRNNSLKDWELVGKGLPMMGYVKTSYIVPIKNKLRMGTSRGAFEHELIENSTAEAQISVNKNTADTKVADSLSFRDYSAYFGDKNIKFEWFFEGGSPQTSTLENPNVLYKTVGKFDVRLKITDSFGNTSTQTLEDFITVSGPVITSVEPDLPPSVEVIPNPTSQNLIRVRVQKIDQPSFRLSTLAGKDVTIVVKKYDNFWHILPKQHLKSGTYLLTVTNEKGKWTRKVWVE